MATATVNITGTITGLIGGSRTLAPPTISNTSAPNEARVESIGVTYEQIAIPTGAVGVLIVPPAGNTNTLKLRGDATDTDVHSLDLHLTNPTFLSFDTGATLWMKASAATNVEFTFV